MGDQTATQTACTLLGSSKDALGLELLDFPSSVVKCTGEKNDSDDEPETNAETAPNIGCEALGSDMPLPVLALSVPTNGIGSAFGGGAGQATELNIESALVGGTPSLQPSIETLPENNSRDIASSQLRGISESVTLLQSFDKFVAAKLETYRSLRDAYMATEEQCSQSLHRREEFMKQMDEEYDVLSSKLKSDVERSSESNRAESEGAMSGVLATFRKRALEDEKLEKTQTKKARLEANMRTIMDGRTCARHRQVQKAGRSRRVKTESTQADT